MNVLLTNDDGLGSAGILALRDAFEPFGKVCMVAPETERSGTSQALTIQDDIYVRRVDDYSFMVNGYPVDCVNVGLHGGIFELDFDLVLSGINHGVNMGDDVHYSGTVGAARHAFVHGYPALAISCDDLEGKGDFTPIADFCQQFIAEHREILDRPTLLNLNYPTGKPLRGLKWTKLGRRIYRDRYQKTDAGEGAFFFNLGGSILSHEERELTDFTAFEEGYISATPLKLDATNQEQWEEFSKRS